MKEKSLTQDQSRLLDRILKEINHGDRDLFESLNQSEKDLVVSLLSEIHEGDNSLSLNLLWEVDYRERPVSIEQFMSDENYLGYIGAGIYDKWKEDLSEIFSPGKQIWEVILTGAIGGGKCLVEGSLVPTNCGLLPIEDVVSRVKQGREVRVRSHLGPDREITEAFDEGVHPTIRIRTKFNYELEGRADHRVIVLRGTEFDWCRLGDLNLGDCVVLERGTNLWGSEEISKVEAECLGIWTGDGSFDVNSIHIFVGKKEYSYQRHIRSLFGELGRVCESDDKTCHRMSLHSKQVKERWEEFGCVTGSHNKRVPDVIMRGSRRNACAFLRGLFDTDGSVEDHAVTFATVSSQLAYEVQLLLLNLGIASSRNFKHNDYEGCWWLRIIGKCGWARFYHDIGFAHPKKSKRLFNFFRAGPKTWRRNDADVLYGMQWLIKEAWESLPSPRKKFSGMFAPRWGKQNIQRRTLRAISDLFVEKESALPARLKEILDRDLMTLPVKDIEEDSGHCYDISVPPDESYVAGGFLSHNTTIASLCQLYKLYRLSCLKDPQAFYGMLPGSMIVIGLFTVLKYKVETTSYARMESMLENSPYFKEKWERDKRKSAEIKFPSNVRVVTGATEIHALGENIYGCIIDEVDFMRAGTSEEDKGQAFKLHNALSRRMASRFMRLGQVPGLLMLVSSKTSESGYVEQRVREKRNDPHTYISDYALWEVKPKSNYCGKTFPVFVGDRYNSSKILTEEEAEIVKGKVVRVPTEHRIAFEEDLDASIRDVAGESTYGVRPFIPDRDKVYSCIDTTRSHPFTREEFSITIDCDDVIEDFLDHKAVFRIRGSKFAPRVRAGAQRFIHIDIGLTGDSLGISMGHACGFRTVTRANDEGFAYETNAPLIYIDLMLGVVPSVGTRIDLQKTRDFVYALREYGFPIQRITLDGYQSEDSMQQFLKQGFESKILSIDKNDIPYIYLRQAILEDRISYYKHDRFIDEVVNLQRDMKKRKVDHPVFVIDSKGRKVRGKKDISDAVAGVVTNCMEESAASPESPPPQQVQKIKMSVKPAAGFMLDDSWVMDDYGDKDTIIGVQ